MSLPFFYSNEINSSHTSFVLNEETSKHVVQVLRMKPGEQLQLTDGKGNIFTTEITDDHKKRTAVKILSSACIQAPRQKISIAISLVKNNSRFEWFLEKATEIGVNEIIPLICTRTEKQHFRYDRMNAILISAMLQSQQSWLPDLHEPIPFNKLVNTTFVDTDKFIAHCLPEQKQSLHQVMATHPARMILIGPEGDFTNDEIEAAIKNNFQPVALGETRLRTETAGMYAAVLLRTM